MIFVQKCGGKMSKIKVLEVNINDIGQGGAWAFIKNAINSKANRDSDNVIMDFFSLEPFENEENVQFIENAKGKVIVKYTANRIIRQIKTYFDLKSVLKSDTYDIVHIHSDVSYKMFVEGLAAKNMGVKRIIFHSHCTGIDRGHRVVKRIAHDICKPFLGMLGTDFFACSQKAGKWMYTNSVNKKLRVINNAVDCKKFSYNKALRDDCRKEFGIDDGDILIGHVGRFMYQKNHEFLIEVFSEIHKERNNAKLLLIGEGDLQESVRKKVSYLNLDNSVIFAGVRNDVNRCMQAMDLLLLPSRFEGLPVVGIEAQAAGLPCLMSDEITKETNLFGLVHFLSLSKSKGIWAKETIELIATTVRKDTYSDMVERGYDISDNQETLKDIYLAIAKNNYNCKT